MNNITVSVAILPLCGLFRILPSFDLQYQVFLGPFIFLPLDAIFNLVINIFWIIILTVYI